MPVNDGAGYSHAKDVSGGTSTICDTGIATIKELVPSRGAPKDDASYSAMVDGPKAGGNSM